MQKLQQSAPISDMRKYQDRVLEMMDNAPVVLMARSRPRAVLIHPDQWDEIAEKLHELENVTQETNDE